MPNSSFNFLKTSVSVAAIMSYIFTIISLSRLFFDLAKLPIFEFVGQIFAVYQAVVHPPVSFVVNILLDWNIGEIGLDLIVLYVAIGFSMRLTFLKVLSLDNRLNEKHYLKPLTIKGLGAFVFGVIVTLFWPTFILWLIELPKLVLRNSGTDHAYLQPANREDINELLKSDSSDILHVYIGDLRYWALWNFLAIIVGVVVLVAFNFISAPFS